MAGVFTLSLNYGIVGHWRIEARLTDSGTKFALEGREFSSLQELVEYHKKNPLSHKISAFPPLLQQPYLKSSTQNVDLIHTIAKKQFTPVRNRGYIVL